MVKQIKMLLGGLKKKGNAHRAKKGKSKEKPDAKVEHTKREKAKHKNQTGWGTH